MFGTDEKCGKYLSRLRWPDGFVCPTCGETQASWLATRQLYKCANGHQISLTNGTAMHRTRTPLSTWFLAAWLLCTHKPGVSALQLAERKAWAEGYNGVWGTLHKLRAAAIAPDRIKLSGAVEVDEFFVGGTEEGAEHRGRGGESKALVMLAVEVQEWKDSKGKLHTKAGRCRMRVVSNATRETCERFIKANVSRDATVLTDGHGGYNRLPRLGYGHEVTIAKRSDDPLPTTGRVVTNLKRWLLGTHKGAVRRQHLQAYLNEFCFRFNRRSDPWLAFNRLLGLATLKRARPGYRTLWKHTWLHPNPRIAEVEIDEDAG